jgi:hypothetical protein
LLGYLAVFAMIACEAYQFAIPFLNTIGVDVSNLASELVGNRIGVLQGFGFAGAAAAAVAHAWYLTIRSAASIPQRWGAEAPGVTAMRAGGACTLCLCLIGITYGIASMRHGAALSAGTFLGLQHGQASTPRMGIGVFVLLTLLVPFAAAYLVHRLSESPFWVRWQVIREKQDQWDRDDTQRHLAGQRLADRLRQRQEKRDRIEQRRDALRHKRRELAERAQAAERRRLARLDTARQYGVAYAHSLLAALTRDRHYFIRAARKRKADDSTGGYWPVPQSS